MKNSEIPFHRFEIPGKLHQALARRTAADLTAAAAEEETRPIHTVLNHPKMVPETYFAQENV